MCLPYGTTGASGRSWSRRVVAGERSRSFARVAGRPRLWSTRQSPQRPSLCVLVEPLQIGRTALAPA
jgi:hypothetical protein